MDGRQRNILHNLETIAHLRGGSIGEAISIKLRPVEDPEQFSDRYVYPREYEELVDAFGLQPAPETRYFGGASYRVGNLDVVEHETGPEFLRGSVV